jgi:tetratricopeptide (TPR) repeat protein/DNA-binding CsgD family transcriptional regulator
MSFDITHAAQQIAEAGSDEQRLALLLEKSMQCYRTNPRQARAWAEEALITAERLERRIEIGRAYISLGSASLQLCEFARAIEELERALSLFEQTAPHSSHRGNAIFVLGITYFLQGRARKGLEHFERALTYFPENPAKQIEIYSMMGNAARSLADYAKALGYQYRSLGLLETVEDGRQRAVVLSNIGNIYLEVRDFEHAQEFLERSLSLSKEHDDLAGTATILYNLASLAQQLKQYEVVTGYTSEALEAAREAECPDITAYVLSVRAEMAMEQGEFAAAISDLNSAIELARSFESHTLIAEASHMLGEALLRHNELPEAIATLTEALGMAEAQEKLTLRCQCYDSLARAYKASGNFERSVEYFTQYMEINGRVNSVERQRAIAEVQARIEIERSDRERRRMEQLALDAADEARLRREQSEQRSKELTSLALQLVQKNEFLVTLKEEIAPNLKASANAKAVVTRIEDHIRSDRDWETFENQFKQVHHDFLQRLSSDHPSLTPTELKVAAMIKLNFSSKAIANLFCLSTRTVENHRQSIRKKLGLSPESNLVSFFTSL